MQKNLIFYTVKNIFLVIITQYLFLSLLIILKINYKNEYEYELKVVEQQQQQQLEKIEKIDNEHHLNSSDEMPPIETFMNVSVKLRKDHLFNYIKCGDVVIGSVEHLNDQRMLMHMICFDNINKKRDCTRLKFNVI